MQPTSDNPRLRPYCLWKDLRQSKESSIRLQSEYKEYFDKIEQKVKRKEYLTRHDWASMNCCLKEYKKCAELYLLRSGAFWNRDLPGDRYQSLRDLCCAVASDPSIKELPIVDTGDDLEKKRAYIISKNYEEESMFHDDEKYPRDPDTFDYTQRFIVGHRNYAKFFGNNDDYIVSYRFDKVYILDKTTIRIIEKVHIDLHSNYHSVKPYPSICMLAVTEKMDY